MILQINVILMFCIQSFFNSPYSYWVGKNSSRNWICLHIFYSPDMSSPVILGKQFLEKATRTNAIAPNITTQLEPGTHSLYKPIMFMKFLPSDQPSLDHAYMLSHVLIWQHSA